MCGEKSNGKSYQVKHKKGVLPYIELLEKLDKEKLIGESYKNDERFILLRRWREDLSSLWIERYFSDVDVERITKGKYNMITCYRKELFLSTYNIETGKAIRGEKIRLCNGIIN